MKRKIILLIFISTSFFIISLKAQNIVPLPVEITKSEGSFIIDNETAWDKNIKAELQPLVNYFTNQIQKISSVNLSSTKSSTKKISLEIGKINSENTEAYTLKITPNQIVIKANSSKGIFYGMQSLLQLLPAIRTNEKLEIPCMEILDYPQFAWRGFMLDSVRHFFSPEAIKEVIDLLALFKLNVFHWHLCDDQGWRLEIKKYPKLTDKSAWREEKEGAVFYKKDSVYLQEMKDKPTYTYGGYYTQEQIKDIVDYAKLRGITIVPEIEMPGHSGAALAAYPELSCNGKPQQVPTIEMSSDFDSFNSNYCPGNPKSFEFLEDIIDEVVTLFPSEYIHIGGDEVNKKDWKSCQKCQKLMRAKGLKNEEELQSYFIQKMEQYINSKGRKIIGWDEILEGGLAPSATVMSWRGEKGGIQSAKMKHYVIMSPGNPLYLNRYQSENTDDEPLAAKFSVNTLEKVYNYYPIPSELSKNEQKYIMGTQAALWTEYIPTLEHLEYMMLPRISALAETLWTPKEKKDYNSFIKRLAPTLQGFGQKGIRYFDKPNNKTTEKK